MCYRTIVMCISLLCITFPAIAAQSTRDVTASDEMKKEALAQVLGSGAKLPEGQEQYAIGHGDILGIDVYGEGTMAVSSPGPSRGGADGTALRQAGEGVQVRIDGRISLKHLGEVQAVGLTLTQLADYLKILYATVYEEPIVTVVLSQGNSQRYTVMGKVNNPGIFYIDYPITLVQVIARSGGFTEWANLELTVVRKNTERTSKLFEGNTLGYDYGDFLDGKELEKNILIEPNDIVIVH